MATHTVPSTHYRWILAVLAGLTVLAGCGSSKTPKVEFAPVQAVPSTTSVAPTTTPTTNANTQPTLMGTGTLPAVVNTFKQGSWNINTYESLDKDPIVLARLHALCNPAPSEWSTFPNVENARSTSCPFKVSNGAEYGVANVPFCQQDTRCDFVVPARHYRLITADYGFMGVTCQQATKGQGCLLLLINVGGESYTFRNQSADNGFSVPGRYWNGDLLEQAIQGLVSHASANMLNLPTNGLKDEVLNAADGTNAGANCGVPQACTGVSARVVIHAGARVLAVAETTITRP